MANVYDGREQTAAKHFILKRYLQTLAFKLLQSHFDTLTYVDGFSGPWGSKATDFSDTSFKIAIDVLKDAQQLVREQRNKRRRVRCFFVEENAANYARLQAAVVQHHDPANDFHVHTFHGRFEDAVEDVMRVVGSSFALTFIDPTGWTGYEFPKIAPILEHKPGEILLNYMKSFIDRFTGWDNPKNTASFEGILGANWRTSLDRGLPKDEAVLELFSHRLAAAGDFRHVLSTPIEKFDDRPAFHIVYGTRSDAGLDAYRRAEFDALRDQGVRRVEARQAEDAALGIQDLFADHQSESLLERRVRTLCVEARMWLVAELHRENGPRRFGDLWPPMLKSFMIRKTNVRTICADLAREGIIRASWRDRGPQKRAPEDDDLIALI